MTASEHERSILSSRVDAAAGAARVARYAEAITASDGDVLGRRAIDAVARAVMAVADEERAADRAEMQATIDRLGERVAYYRDSEVPALRSNADGWAARAEAAEARLDALVSDLRGLADDPDIYDCNGGRPSIYGVTVDRLRAVLDKHAGEQAQGGDGS